MHSIANNNQAILSSFLKVVHTYQSVSQLVYVRMKYQSGRNIHFDSSFVTRRKGRKAGMNEPVKGTYQNRKHERRYIS